MDVGSSCSHLTHHICANPRNPIIRVIRGKKCPIPAPVFRKSLRPITQEGQSSRSSLHTRSDENTPCCDRCRSTGLASLCTAMRALRLSIVGTCWINVGSVLDQCWKHVGSMLEACWINVGSMLDQCWMRVGSMLDACWINVGSVLDQCWMRVGSVRVTDCTHIGSVWRPDRGLVRSLLGSPQNRTRSMCGCRWIGTRSAL